MLIAHIPLRVTSFQCVCVWYDHTSEDALGKQMSLVLLELVLQVGVTQQAQVLGTDL